MKKILFALMLALFVAPGVLFAADNENPAQKRHEEVDRVDVSKLPL